jgi:ATP-dependent Clp protease adaptor protein ClpS
MNIKMMVEDIKTHKIVLYNDKKNNFLYIIACLIKYCKHDSVQAEQCALIAHNIGKCSIMSGEYLDMLEIKTYLDNKNIVTKIKDNESDMH